MTTVARNATRKIAALKATHTVCRSYTLYHQFVPQDCDPAAAWEAVAKGARIHQADNGRVTVYVHGNHWYYLTEPAPPTGCGIHRDLANPFCRICTDAHEAGTAAPGTWLLDRLADKPDHQSGSKP